MKPSPGDVASQVTAIVNSPWPRGLEDGLPWLQSMGIETGTAEETPPRGATRSWHLASMPAWGTADAGWGTYRDELADVSWFLWNGETAEDVLAAAAELAEAMTSVHGDPVEATEPALHAGPTWWWRLERHGIQMYAYDGAPNAEGYPTGPPCVQLHVDLRAVSEPQEAEARREDLRGED